MTAPLASRDVMDRHLGPREPARRDGRWDGVLLVAVMAVLMWAVEVIDVFTGDLDANGIRPRDPEGLVGIVTAPFLHAGFGHLLGNTLPFMGLGVLVAVGGLARVAAVTAIVAIVAGLGTWLTAADGTVHVGASGMVFGYAAYLVGRGVFSRRLAHIAVGVAVLAVYGTTLGLGLLPEAGISWQGHAFGALGGLLAARALDSRRVVPRAAPAARPPYSRA